MATNIKHTVESILQIISDLRGESSTNTDASRIRAVSRANKDFSRRQYWKFYRLTDQTDTGDGTNDYTIGSSTYPMREKGLCEVFVDGTTESSRHHLVDQETAKLLYNANNSTKYVYQWLDVANDAWKMHINPAPDTGLTITYSFYFEAPAVTATTDYVICPNPKIIALMALGDIYQGEEEINKANALKSEAEQLISEIEGVDEAPHINQINTVYAIENELGNKGFGNY